MSAAGCEEFRELISAFVDDRLVRSDLLRLEGHLGACAACRHFEGEMRRLRELLQAAEAFRPLRRPPPGFAAAVAARVAAEPPAAVVAFPGPARVPRRMPAARLGFAAAAAAAALFFVWSWQRLVPGEVAGQRAAVTAAPVAVVAAAGEDGSIDDLLRRHATLARDATILGHAEEVEFASFRPAAAPER